VLRDKFALGLFENPYVPENPAEIRTVAREGVELSKRLAAASVTLLKNENGLLPLGRDIAKIAIVGPHADDVEVGFTTYMYANALKMYHARATGGDIAMAGVGLGAPPPPEAKAALAPKRERRSRSIAGSTSSPTTRRCPSPRRSPRPRSCRAGDPCDGSRGH
jgi:beta-glucosidase